MPRHNEIAIYSLQRYVKILKSRIRGTNEVSGHYTGKRRLVDWLVDIPGVNAQEKTRDKLLESLRIGMEDMLHTECVILEGTYLETIEI